jgi:RNA polymerase sigma-70 factor (ECF subfamily)
VFPGLAEKARRVFARNECPDADEAVLVAGVAAGDDLAFKTLYRIYHPRLSRFIGLMARRSTLVEEAVNDTMLVVWRRADTYNGQCKVSTWIFAIAYRTVLKALRQQDEPVETPPCVEPALASAEPEAQRSLQETKASLLRALGGLSPEQRSALVLTYFHDMPCAEIARVVDCPEATVKTRVFHGRRRLRQLLAGDAEDWL